MVSIAVLLSLFECATEDAWTKTMFSIVRALDVEYVLYGVILNKLLPLQNAFIKSNYPQGWRDTYDTGNLSTIDPTVSHCLASSVPIIWRPGIFVTKAQKALSEQAGSYGLRFGVSLPAHGANGEFGMLNCATGSELAMRALARDNKRMADLALVRDYTFESSLKFLKTERDRQAIVKLTNRERECLSWIMIGKSSWEISQILNCAEATINFHVGNIKDKFNVRTRQQAVAKAIMAGAVAPH